MKNKYILSFLSAALLFSSCSKDYIVRTPYNAVPLTTAVGSESDLSVALDGVYAGLRNIGLFGRTLPVKGDLLADNTFITTSNSNRYITENSFTQSVTDAGVGSTAEVWAPSYVVIKNANNVIKAGATLPASANVNQYVGESYALRALAYFELVRNYGHAFTIAPDDPGVPIVSDSLTFDETITGYKPPRSSVRQVYTKIIADLEKAYSLMTIYRGTAFFSKYGARALEARVYMTMGDWTNAKTVSLDVINNSGWVLLAPTAYVSPGGVLGGTTEASTLNTYTPGGYWASPTVQTTTKNETFFEVASDLLSNAGFDELGYIYLQVGGGYGDVLATDDLYNQYSATDVRRGLIPRCPLSYRAGQGGNINLCYKYPNPANGADKDDTKVIRLAEVILIAAEAYYNAGDYTNANLYLNKVAVARDPAFAGWADTGAQVLEDILVERRKELAFEGQRLWDLVRLKRTWTKVKNQSPLSTVTITYNSSTWSASPVSQIIFAIPQAEINANPNIVPPQNPGY